jgi:hypothetical protein
MRGSLSMTRCRISSCDIVIAILNAFNRLESGPAKADDLSGRMSLIFLSY